MPAPPAKIGTVDRAARPRAVRLPSIAALVDPAALTPVLGVPVLGVQCTPVPTHGRSSATHARVVVDVVGGARLNLWLKRDRPADDWLARRGADTAGREAALLAEPAFAAVWEVFRCPYRAFAREADEYALLMDDLTERLASSEGPVPAEREQAMLAALAALHARYWDVAPDRTWLLSTAQALTMLSADAPDEEARRGSPQPIFEWVRQGWAALARRAPAPVYRLLADPGPALAQLSEGIPHTLLHGDARLENFGFLPDGEIAAFDWAMAGLGPPTLDVGWYLILNARQRVAAHEDVLHRYRLLLEAALGHAVPASQWQRLEDAGVLYGAAMLLWDRTLDLEDELPGAAEEWNWWVERVKQVRRRA